ncbi:outer membrane protein assembly factor BamD [Methylomarinum sp. Ch1-1]|uniref:Outer membrane protein assembly factor BamD n=1 Tax=Methylomarinum roseum TaxID=3067653 RepID=A0AAU7NWY7_9GAMM|nr:outer membrane protein assembly factor BamD [Methylomarinum sp. Ch1-1]MDP4522418.1 outer membrane protein assembly factor BamD [Methylomarinum sp. Ch1-1]
MRLLLIKFLFLFALLAPLAGCETLKNLQSADSGSDAEYNGWDAKQFHDKARDAMKAGNYQKAIKLYETLEARYPFGDYAAQTQLDVAYAYYKNDDPEAAIAAADRFIKIHPRNPSVDYAYYLKGLVNYNRGIGFIDRFLPTDASQRDPGNARDAYDNFAELIRRFPDSKYVPDAKQRMIALKNNLAMYEVHVARFYLKRRAYVAAANRASHVVQEYQRTPAVPYALEIMQQAYGKLNLSDLEADAKRVYQLNYPDGPPIRKDEAEKTFVESLWDSIGFDE